MTITPTTIPSGPKRIAQGSTRLLHEWSQKQPWDVPPFFELRLGPTTQSTPGVQMTPQIEAMLRVSNWFADMVGVTPTSIKVIEAKLDPDPGAVGQALFYSRLVMTTPVLRAYASRPIQPVVLFAADDPDVRRMANSLGVGVEVYTPAWYADYLIQRRYRRRTAGSS